MRITMAAAGLVVWLLATNSRADETSEFLKKDQWEGIAEYWTVDGTTVTGKSEKPIPFNTFLCSKQEYGDFELKCKLRLAGGKGNSECVPTSSFPLSPCPLVPLSRSTAASG